MKKINNLNEEINRIKSLFTEERLYGNLVKKELITEQVIKNIGRTIGKSIDDIIKAGDDVVKNIKIPKKQLDDFKLKMSGVKSFDDMAVALKNTEYDKIWSMLGFSDKQLFGIRQTLNPPYNGNFGRVVEASGYPLFRYLPNETKHVKNFRKDMFDMWLVHGPKEEVDVFLKDYKKGLSKFSDDAIERTKSAREKPKVKPDEPKVKPDEPKVKPDDDAVKGLGEPKTTTDPVEAAETIATETQKGKNVKVTIEGDAEGVEKILKGGDEGLTSSKSADDAVEEAGEEMTKGMGPGAKKRFLNGEYWAKAKPWFVEKWTRKVLNPLTIGEELEGITYWGRKSERVWKITTRTIGQWFFWHMVTGGAIPGPGYGLGKIWNWLKETRFIKYFTNMFGEDACEGVFEVSDGLIDCGTLGYEIQQQMIANLPDDCEIYLRDDNETIIASIMNIKSAPIRVLIKEKYEKKYGERIDGSVLNEWMDEVETAINLIQDEDSGLDDALNKSIDDMRDQCAVDKTISDSTEDGLTFEKVESTSDPKNKNTDIGGGSDDGGGCDCGNGYKNPACCK
tara:strand:+ start:3808 stop:5499 length:1692 start_codon:yes stop_codon:yes gene_type:complete